MKIIVCCIWLICAATQHLDHSVCWKTRFMREFMHPQSHAVSCNLGRGPGTQIMQTALTIGLCSQQILLRLFAWYMCMSLFKFLRQNHISRIKKWQITLIVFALCILTLLWPSCFLLIQRPSQGLTSSLNAWRVSFGFPWLLKDLKSMLDYLLLQTAPAVISSNKKVFVLCWLDIIINKRHKNTMYCCNNKKESIHKFWVKIFIAGNSVECLSLWHFFFTEKIQVILLNVWTSPRSNEIVHVYT